VLPVPSGLVIRRRSSLEGAFSGLPSPSIAPRPGLTVARGRSVELAQHDRVGALHVLRRPEDVAHRDDVRLGDRDAVDDELVVLAELCVLARLVTAPTAQGDASARARRGSPAGP
jgi:hypothetical protein